MDTWTAFNNATDGMTDSPNVILSDQATLEYYNRTLLSTTRYLDAQSHAGQQGRGVRLVVLPCLRGFAAGVGHHDHVRPGQAALGHQHGDSDRLRAAAI